MPQSKFRPNQHRIENEYQMGIRAAIGLLYRKHRSLEGIAEELGVSRQLLYKWLGSRELGMLKAQARMREGEETQELVAGVMSGR
jgi:AcrR family transcriptional regulator